jgi:protein phosphatase
MKQEKGMPEKMKDLLLEKARLQKELAEAERERKLKNAPENIRPAEMEKEPEILSNEEKLEPTAPQAPEAAIEPELEYEQGQERTRKIVRPDSKAGEKQELKPAVEAWGSVSSIANERHPERNEDATLENTKHRVWGIFDGVGGAEKGEIASRLASDYVASHLPEISDGMSIELAKTAISTIIVQTDKTINEEGEAKNSDMGTTCAVLKIHIDETGKSWALIGSVGDSRVYKISNDGKIEQITEDDDVVKITYETLPKKSPQTEKRKEEIIKKISEATNIEDLDEEERIFFKRRNEIGQALGSGDSIPNIYSVPANNGDGFLITSDGIHDNLTTEEIEQVLKESDSLKEASDNLVEKSRTRSREKGFRSKQDDMSAIVVEVGSLPNQTPEAPVGESLEPFGGREPEPFESATAQMEISETLETKPFSIHILQRKLQEFLNSIKELEKISEVKVKGKGEEISIAFDLEVRGVKRLMVLPKKGKGAVSVILKNEGNSIAVKEHHVTAAKKDKVAMEEFLGPILNQLSQKIKGFVEKEEKSDVKKMEIVNGQLIISKTTIKPATEEEITARPILGSPVTDEVLEELVAMPRKEAIGKMTAEFEKKTARLQAIAQMKNAIADAERILAENKAEREKNKLERETIMKRLAEIREANLKK